MDIEAIKTEQWVAILGAVTALITVLTTVVTVILNAIGQKRRDKTDAGRISSESDKIRADTARIFAEARREAAEADVNMWKRANDNIESLQIEFDREREKRQALESLAETQHDELGQCSVANARLATKAEQQESRIAALEAAVAYKSDQIISANQRARDEEQQKNDLRKLVIEQGHRIDSMERKISTYAERIRALEAENSRLKHELRNIES